MSIELGVAIEIPPRDITAPIAPQQDPSYVSTVCKAGWRRPYVSGSVKCVTRSAPGFEPLRLTTRHSDRSTIAPHDSRRPSFMHKCDSLFYAVVLTSVYRVLIVDGSLLALWGDARHLHACLRVSPAEMWTACRPRPSSSRRRSFGESSITFQARKHVYS